jgi:prepilin-type N-terminal cleavage/methylation domain-containing protein
MKKTCSKPLFLKSGFTLIELLVTITMMAILFTFGVAQFLRFARHQELAQSAQELKTNLRFTQNKASAGEKPTACVDVALVGHKLVFDDNKNYRIVAVCGGSEVEIKTGLSLRNDVTLSSGNEVFFKVLAQGVEEAETFTLHHAHGSEWAVTVTRAGEIISEEIE